MSGRVLSIPLALAIGLAIHVDWHLARPMDQRLSAAWSTHWLLAIPLFFGVASYFARRRAGQGMWPVVLTVAVGVVLGEGVEPVLEVIGGDSFAEAYEPARVRAFVEYMAAGLVTLVASLVGLSLSRREEHG